MSCGFDTSAAAMLPITASRTGPEKGLARKITLFVSGIAKSAALPISARMPRCAAASRSRLERAIAWSSGENYVIYGRARGAPAHQ